MNILLFGPNGSGKGTQGSLLKDRFHLAHIRRHFPGAYQRRDRAW